MAESTVHIPIDHSVSVIVSVGDILPPSSVFAKKLPSVRGETIDVAHLLNVKSGSIGKYLTVSIGQRIEAGTVIAKKSSLVSKTLIHSPISGYFQDIDLHMGTVTLAESVDGKESSLICPVAARVKAVTKEAVTLVIHGVVIEGIFAKGDETVGTFQYISESHMHSLSVPEGVERCIIGCRQILDDAVVKFDVLGVGGFVVTTPIQNPTVSYTIVSEDVFSKLSAQHNHVLWMRPSERQLIFG